MRTRLERAIDKRDDRQAYLDKWSFGMLPSEIRRRQRAIARAQAEVDRLTPVSTGCEFTGLDPCPYHPDGGNHPGAARG